MKTIVKNYLGLFVGVVIGASVATLVTMITYGYTPDVNIDTKSIKEFQECLAAIYE